MPGTLDPHDERAAGAAWHGGYLFRERAGDPVGRVRLALRTLRAIERGQ